ncbi:TonB-dependent receptor [Thiomicrorhabdus immobilis]|uniref:TonB-dependent receptor n=1 Tax=Thiomicrorhabdus immobilis TaxID=2791037 RepID=A0ABN6CVJ2_9GAMM|nr:TonB-dependent receptor [Thiomicrorhabdus immobilis]BCN93038.1 TonB-dependent receptor [Thiomicrorhabdus immobilis]
MKKKLLASIIASMLSPAVYADSLPQIEVIGTSEQINQQQITQETIQSNSSSTSDVVNILKNSPSVSVNQAGPVSGFPVIRGIADHRLNVELDGMPLLASCPNHMNTPLSYTSPSQVDNVEIYPGITPVSVGGDSIGGSILVKTNEPFFAPTSEVVTKGEIGAYYRNNGDAKGGNVAVTTANDKFSLTYKGSKAMSGNYDAADDFKDFTTTTKSTSGTEFTSGTEGTTTDKDEVAGTAYESINHSLGFAYKGDDNLFQATITKQEMPYQQYPNQRMDMTQNDSTKLNLSFDQAMSWGDLKLQAYSEEVDHKMAFMDYKIQTQMPMDTESETKGVKASALVALDNKNDLNIGAELQTYTLDDYWVANPASPGMSPNTFWNINNGTRDRNALFAEWIKEVSPAWKTRLGARYELVNMNADEVQGYHDADTFTKGTVTMTTNEASEAAAFNASDRSVTDHNLNLTALASYKASDTFDMDMGFARQVRSPTLYERYTWSTWSMAAVMNNFVGDGNGYIGDINLEPETAYTLSTTLDWHAANQKDWSVQVMPYFSHIENYIDAELVKSYGDFGVYQYVNESARIYGLDVAANTKLAENEFGDWKAKAKVNYARGINLETDDNLYNIMPLNATVAVMQQLNRWNNSVELVLVSDKTEVSENRNELKTAGYSLVNMKTSYTLKNLRIDFGIDNLFNHSYDLPTGGVYTGEGKTMSITGIPQLAVPGAGRTFYAGLNLKF